MADVVERLRHWADWPEHPGTNQDLRDAATEIETLRALSQAGAGGGVAVKPLEWSEPAKLNNGCWTADCILGTYSIAFDDGWYACLEDGARWEWEPEQDPRSYEGPYAAQAACQAHLEARILSALAPRPSAGEPIAWVIPGDDNARDDGSIDAMAWQDGEFSRPLYAAPPATPVQPIASVEGLGECCDGYEAQIAVLQQVIKDKNAIIASLTPAPTPAEDGGGVLAGWCQPNGITKQAQHDIDQAIGGTYELPDGRSFWLDHVAVKEIMRRAIPYIAAECERHRLVGGRTAKPAKQGGC